MCAPLSCFLPRGLQGQVRASPQFSLDLGAGAVRTPWLTVDWLSLIPCSLHSLLLPSSHMFGPPVRWLPAEPCWFLSSPHTHIHSRTAGGGCKLTLLESYKVKYYYPQCYRWENWLGRERVCRSDRPPKPTEPCTSLHHHDLEACNPTAEERNRLETTKNGSKRSCRLKGGDGCKLETSSCLLSVSSTAHMAHPQRHAPPSCPAPPNWVNGKWV